MIFADPFYLRDAVALVEEVLLTVMGVTAEHVQPQDSNLRIDYVCGVNYFGDWRGSFYVGVPAGLAAELTRRFVPSDGAGFTPDDIQDALGELANLIGGNLKALLPGAAHVTIPVSEPAARPGKESWLLQFRCLGQPIWMWLDYASESASAEALDSLVQHG